MLESQFDFYLQESNRYRRLARKATTATERVILLRQAIYYEKKAYQLGDELDTVKVEVYPPQNRHHESPLMLLLPVGVLLIWGILEWFL